MPAPHLVTHLTLCRPGSGSEGRDQGTACSARRDAVSLLRAVLCAPGAGAGCAQGSLARSGGCSGTRRAGHATWEGPFWCFDLGCRVGQGGFCPLSRGLLVSRLHPSGPGG